MGAKSRTGPSKGELYSVKGEEGFRVAKILAVDDGGVHIRLYSNLFESRPSKVKPSTLSLGKLGGSSGFGMGHMPMSHSTFRNWQPVFVQNSRVVESELEGYRMWEEARGGYW